MINATFSSFLHPLFFGLWHLPSLTHIYLSVFTNFLHICRGTKWICSSKYLFFRQICADQEIQKKQYVLGRKLLLLGYRRFRLSEGIAYMSRMDVQSEEQINFPLQSPKMLKMVSEIFIHALLFFQLFFSKFPVECCTVPQMIPNRK